MTDTNISTADRVKNVMRVILGTMPEDMRDEAVLVKDLGADSLDSVEFVIDFEEEFDIEINDVDIDSVKTVGDAIRLVEAKLQAQKETA